MRDLRLWHGGIPGLRVGDLIAPGHKRKKHVGCPFCEARERGEALAGIDRPSARQDHIYITASKEYARHYASLYGRGDLYTVEPVGEMEVSKEDNFPCWSVPSARVVGVYQRAILLSDTQRRSLWRLWTKADEDAITSRQGAKP